MGDDFFDVGFCSAYTRSGRQRRFPGARPSLDTRDRTPVHHHQSDRATIVWPETARVREPLRPARARLVRLACAGATRADILVGGGGITVLAAGHGVGVWRSTGWCVNPDPVTPPLPVPCQPLRFAPGGRSGPSIPPHPEAQAKQQRCYTTFSFKRHR